MNRCKRGSRTIRALTDTSLVLALSGILATPAFAYVDPGTGSIILQSLLAGIALAIGFTRIYWYRLKSFVSRMVGSPDLPEPELESGIAEQSDSTVDS